MASDPVSAVEEYLRDAINDIDIYGEEVPLSVADDIPFKGIVVASGGGRGDGLSGRSYQHVGYRRVEIRSYAESVYEARQIDERVALIMRDMRRTGKTGYSGLFSSIVIGGPISLRDPDTKWPFFFTVYRVMVGEVENT